MMTIALNLLDIAGNCFEAGASEVYLSLKINEKEGMLQMRVEDNGKGMDEQTLKKVCDPFYTTRTTRKVGMGLALLRQQTEAAGGELQISSEPGNGTRLEARFGLAHPDRQPLGDVAGVIIMLAGRDNSVRLRFEALSPEGTYLFDTKEIMEVLDIKTINEPGLLPQLRELLENKLRDLGFERLN